MAETGDKNSTQVIVRVSAILKVLGESTTGITITDLARRCELPRSTVHRLVFSLEDQQLVMVTKDGVRLGPELLSLASAAQMDFVTVARPTVEALGRKTRETIDVSVCRGAYAISVDQYQSDQELRVVSPIGTAFPIHCSAHGKALLSLVEDNQLIAMLETKLERRTSNSLVDPGMLREEIQRIQRQGYAIDNEEHAEGVCGIGFALQCGPNAIYAVSIAIPAQRFIQHKVRYIADLLGAKSEIKQRLQLSQS